jgi:Eukaryotic DNA topoisomerase I, catalytic core
MHNNFQTDVRSGGMSPGGNRVTQIPASRIYFDPEADHQGSGFWAGKYAPSGRSSKRDPNALDQSHHTSYQDKAVDLSVVRYFEGNPVDDEETIKSLTSVEVFSLAKQALKAGNRSDYAFFKGELERRAFMATVAKTMARVGQELEQPAAKDKRVFDAMHGVDDETSTEDQDSLSVPAPEEGEGQVEKAKVSSEFSQRLAGALGDLGKPKESKAPTNAPEAVVPVAVKKETHQKNYERRDPRSGKMENVHGHGHAKTPEAEEESEAFSEEESADPNWSTLENYGFKLPPPYKSRGLKVAGEVNAMAEEMFYRLAPYLKNDIPPENVPDDVFCQNFASDLLKYAKVQVAPNIEALRTAGAACVKQHTQDSLAKAPGRRAKAAARRKMDEKQKWVEDKAADPHNFMKVDGKEVRAEIKVASTLLQSAVFIGTRTEGKWGAKLRGHWVPAITYKDITLNGSKFPSDLEKYKGSITNPNVEWTARIDYAPGCGRGSKPVTIPIEGKVHKRWGEVRQYGENYDTIIKGIERDLHSDNAKTKELATALAIMDALHIRNGGKADTTGAVDLKTSHIWIHKSTLRFDFLAKSNEHEKWDRMGVRRLSPQTIKNLRALGVGDEPAKDGVLVFGHTKPSDINGWLQHETHTHITAHKVRHFHASRYFSQKFEELKEKLGKPESKGAAKKMLSEATYYASLMLGHKVVEGKAGNTARKHYIDPVLLQSAMEWTGYDLSNSYETSHKWFKFKKELKKALGEPGQAKPFAVLEPFYVGGEIPAAGCDCYSSMISYLVFGESTEKSLRDWLPLVIAHEAPVPLVVKAIGTKSSDRREKPVKRAKPNVTAKVTSTKSGKKNYDYRKPGASVGKKGPAETKPKGGSLGPESMMTEVQPDKLAKLIGVSVEQLQKLASSMDEWEFVAHLKSKGSSFLAKHKVSGSYLSSLYAVLARDAVKSFKVHPAKLKKGSEERAFAESMLVSRVNTLSKLATFLAKGYDLSASSALKMARELHATLRSEGALK